MTRPRTVSQSLCCVASPVYGWCHWTLMFGCSNKVYLRFPATADLTNRSSHLRAALVEFAAVLGCRKGSIYLQLVALAAPTSVPYVSSVQCSGGQ